MFNRTEGYSSGWRDFRVDRGIFKRVEQAFRPALKA
jgi:hypothetical protein